MRWHSTPMSTENKCLRVSIDPFWRIKKLLSTPNGNPQTPINSLIQSCLSNQSLRALQLIKYTISSFLASLVFRVLNWWFINLEFLRPAIMTRIRVISVKFFIFFCFLSHKSKTDKQISNCSDRYIFQNVRISMWVLFLFSTVLIGWSS